MAGLNTAWAVDKVELEKALRKIERAELRIGEARQIIEDQLYDQAAWSCTYGYPFGGGPYKGEGATEEQAKEQAIQECHNTKPQGDCRYYSNKNGYMSCIQNF